MEILFRMNSSFRRCRPRSSVHSRSLSLFSSQRFPFDEKRDGIFSSGDTVVRCGSGNTGTSGSGDFGGPEFTFDEPTVDVDVVTVEVVGDVGIDTGPCSEGFELTLGLTASWQRKVFSSSEEPARAEGKQD